MRQTGLPNGCLYCKPGAYQLEPVNGTGAGGQDLGVRGDFKVIGAVQNEKSCTFQNCTELIRLNL